MARISKQNKIPAQRWLDVGKLVIITDYLVSPGFDGDEWVRYFFDGDVQLPHKVVELLGSPKFDPFAEGSEFRFVILRGSAVFASNRWKTRDIISYARKTVIDFDGTQYVLLPPNMEHALILRDHFSNEEIRKMGFTKVVPLHEPVKTKNCNNHLLAVDAYSNHSFLNVVCDGDDQNWPHDYGFLCPLLEVVAAG